jgi:signal transduction histidine kinase
VRRVLLVDSLLALAVAAFAEYAIHQPWDDGHRAGSVALNAPLVALAVLPLALRRTAPALGLVLMAACLGVPSVVVAHDILFWAGFLPLLLMVYSAARRDDGPVGASAWLVGPVLFTLEVAHVPELRTLNEFGFDLLAILTAWGIGRGMRRLDVQEHELSQALVELEQQRVARKARAVEEERTRMAGEMHDVVAHAVSLMVLQVGAARLEVETAGASPEAAGQLRAAENAGREALDQLRRSLSALRRSPA